MGAAVEWTTRLREKYPWFPDEVYCGPGWAALIEELCDKIQAFLDAHEDYRSQFYVTVCKEKYARLHFYAFPERDEVEELIREAGDESQFTCERCGEPGEIRGFENAGSLLAVRCDRCRRG